MADFRKVILGDKSVAGRYMSMAARLFDKLERSGLPKKIFKNYEIILIATNYQGQRKCIFIVTGVKLIYIEKVTTEGVVHYWGWGPKHSFQSLFNIDLNDYPGFIPDQSLVSSYEISLYNLDEDSYLGFRKDQSAKEPVLMYIPINGSKNTQTPEIPNYPAAPFNFKRTHRGVDRDFFYTASGYQFGDSDNAEVYERLWDDEDKALALVKALPEIYMPFDPFLRMYWPAVGFDSGSTTHWSQNGNTIWILAEVNAVKQYGEVWRLIDGVLVKWTIMYYAFGVDGRKYYSHLLTNNIPNDVEMAMTINEYYDAAGDPSDLCLIFNVFGGAALDIEFYPGDYLDYSGRIASQVQRGTAAIKVAEDVYIFFLINFQFTSEIPDAVFRIARTDAGLEIKVVYQAPIGHSLRYPLVNPSVPGELMFGEDNNRAGDPEGGKGFFLNGDTEEFYLIRDNRGILQSGAFVR